MGVKICYFVKNLTFGQNLTFDTKMVRENFERILKIQELQKIICFGLRISYTVSL